MDNLRRCVRRAINVLLESHGYGDRLAQAINYLSDAMFHTGCGTVDASCTEPEQVVAKAVASLRQSIQGTRVQNVRLRTCPVGVTRSEQVQQVSDQLRCLFEPMLSRNDVLLLALHGSLSTEDFVEFSDLDAVAVFKDNCFVSHDYIRMLRRDMEAATAYVRAVDPYSHHGIMVLREGDLAAYDESFLPLVQWGNASRIVGPDIVRFGCRPCREESLKQLQSHARAILLVPHNAFEVKLLVSRILLAPAVLVQCVHGVYVDKALGIEYAARHFPRRAWAAVAAGEEVRRTWRRHRPPTGLPSNMFDDIRSLSEFCLSEASNVAPLITQHNKETVV